MDGVGELVVVGVGAGPVVEEVDFVECAVCEGHGTAPGVGVFVSAHEGGDGGIDDAGEVSGEVVLFGDEPAVGGGGADLLVVEIDDHLNEPFGVGDGIGIGEDDDVVGVCGVE